MARQIDLTDRFLRYVTLRYVTFSMRFHEKQAISTRVTMFVENYFFTLILLFTSLPFPVRCRLNLSDLFHLWNIF